MHILYYMLFSTIVALILRRHTESSRRRVVGITGLIAAPCILFYEILTTATPSPEEGDPMWAVAAIFLYIYSAIAATILVALEAAMSAVVAGRTR